MRTVALQLHAKYPNSFVPPINDALLLSGFLQLGSVFIIYYRKGITSGRRKRINFYSGPGVTKIPENAPHDSLHFIGKILESVKLN